MDFVYPFKNENLVGMQVENGVQGREYLGRVVADSGLVDDILEAAHVLPSGCLAAAEEHHRGVRPA
ncbi:MAG: hypothetical protein RDU30_06835 [Desulfovibrionaceae bacterium]|nr:hypothetical protein [Desulfovibrionaceae bacterium]